MRGSGNVGLRLRGEGLRVQDFNVEEFVKVAVRVVHASGIQEFAWSGLKFEFYSFGFRGIENSASKCRDLGSAFA